MGEDLLFRPEGSSWRFFGCSHGVQSLGVEGLRASCWGVLGAGFKLWRFGVQRLQVQDCLGFGVQGVVVIGFRVWAGFLWLRRSFFLEGIGGLEV